MKNNILLYPIIKNGLKGVAKVAKDRGFYSFSFDKKNKTYTFPISDKKGYAFKNQTNYLFKEKNTPYKENHSLGDEILWTYEVGFNKYRTQLLTLLPAIDQIYKKWFKEEVEKDAFVVNSRGDKFVRLDDIIRLLTQTNE